MSYRVNDELIERVIGSGEVRDFRCMIYEEIRKVIWDMNDEWKAGGDEGLTEDEINEVSADLEWLNTEEIALLEDAEMLGKICTRDEAGRHFTDIYEQGWLIRMEEQGFLEIIRPVHGTGIAYGQEEWSVKITPAGIEFGESMNWGVE